MPLSYSYGGDGGGGYMQGQGTQGGGGGGDRVFNKRPPQLTPVTLRQLVTAIHNPSEDCLRLDDREIYNIRVVAQIVTAQETATGFSMQLDDGTAMMEARVWMDMSGGHGGADGSGGPGQSDYNVQHRGEWVEGAYVSLVGHPKIFQERRSIVAQRVRTITDHNEITHHMLECLYAHLHNKRGGSGTNQYGGGLSSAPGFGGDGGYGGVPGGGNGQMYDEYNYAGGAQGYGDAGGFTQLQTGILNICRRSNSHGAALTDIIQGLASLGDETAIRAAIQNLTDEGHLYTTIDDEHFKATS